MIPDVCRFIDTQIIQTFAAADVGRPTDQVRRTFGQAYFVDAGWGRVLPPVASGHT